jgi:hypothetical protein
MPPATRRIVSFLFLAAVACVPSRTHAQVNLAWNACLGSATASEYVAYACDGSRDGIPFRLAMSFKLPNAVMTWGTLAIVEFQSPDGSLPDYWRLYSTGCRGGILTASSGGAAAGICSPAWPAGVQTPLVSASNASTSTVLAQVLIATGDACNTYPLAPGTYSAGQVLIDPILDVDTGFGACAGCAKEICIRLRSVEVLAPCAGPELILTGPADRDYVHWQGPTPGLCAGATPTRNRTWGAIKAIYR